MQIRQSSFRFLYFSIFSCFLTIGVADRALGLTTRLGIFSTSSLINIADSTSNTYGILTDPGTDMQVGFSQFIGPVEMEIFGGSRSYTLKIPTNIPGPALSSYTNNYTDTYGTIRMGFTRFNLQPYLAYSLDPMFTSPISGTFSILPQTMNFTSLGVKVTGLSQNPSFEINGSVEFRQPITTSTAENVTLTPNYSTLFNAEVRFGQGRHWGIKGSALIQSLSDTKYSYTAVKVTTGLVIAF